MTKLFSKDRANKYFEKWNGRIFCRRNRTSVFLHRYRQLCFVRLRWKQRAFYLAKAIDGVYDSDPKINPAAIEIRCEVSIQEVIDQ